MSVQNHEPQWSDIFQTEMRLPQKRYRRRCILPIHHMAIGSARPRIPTKFMKTVLARIWNFFSYRPPTAPVVSCADPLESYMYACLSAPLFCYVSPAMYGFPAPDDDNDSEQDDER